MTMELYSKVVDEEIKKGASFQEKKRNKVASLKDAKKERMHQCPRIKWSRLRSEQKMNQNRFWSSY